MIDKLESDTSYSKVIAKRLFEKVFSEAKENPFVFFQKDKWQKGASWLKESLRLFLLGRKKSDLNKEKQDRDESEFFFYDNSGKRVKPSFLQNGSSEIIVTIKDKSSSNRPLVVLFPPLTRVGYVHPRLSGAERELEWADYYMVGGMISSQPILRSKLFPEQGFALISDNPETEKPVFKGSHFSKTHGGLTLNLLSGRMEHYPLIDFEETRRSVLSTRRIMMVEGVHCVEGRPKEEMKPEFKADPADYNGLGVIEYVDANDITQQIVISFTCFGPTVSDLKKDLGVTTSSLGELNKTKGGMMSGKEVFEYLDKLSQALIGQGVKVQHWWLVFTEYTGGGLRRMTKENKEILLKNLPRSYQGFLTFGLPK